MKIKEETVFVFIIVAAFALGVLCGGMIAERKYQSVIPAQAGIQTFNENKGGYGHD
ncbi:MAG: hypothetical protein HZB61_10160 [Nitrospirae bacterium]|nr:hypothetical protein [Nitrospirota bacterium]